MKSNGIVRLMKRSLIKVTTKIKFKVVLKLFKSRAVESNLQRLFNWEPSFYPIKKIKCVKLFFTDLECSDWLKSFGMFKNEHSVNLRSNILKTSEPRFNSQ